MIRAPAGKKQRSRIPGVGGGTGIALEKGEHQGPLKQQMQLPGQTHRIGDGQLPALPLQQLAAAGLEGLGHLAGPIARFRVFAGRLDEQTAVERR